MSYYTSPTRIFDVNANNRKETKNYFNFENAYTPPSRTVNNNNNNNNNLYGNSNYSNGNIQTNGSKVDLDDSNNNNNSINGNGNDDHNSRYYNSPGHDSTHNTSGYSSGFDDASYGSNNSIINDPLDDHRHHHHHHLHPHEQHQQEQHEATQEVEYSRAPDTFPCGHVLCHNCVRKFMRMRQRSGYSCCPVCHTPIYEDISLHAMGLAVSSPSPMSPPSTPSHLSPPPTWSRPTSPTPLSPSPSPFSPPPPPSPSPSDPTPISLLTNFEEMVKKFTGFDHGYPGLRRLKDESVRSKSMGMTFTNTQCHLCMENHGTLRIVQEYNQLSVKHERPNLWSNYFYRLQHGKVVTEFHSKVNSSCICVPCTYRELQQRNIPEVKALPRVNPNTDTSICLAEVGKILAKNSAPIMALQGKNVIEIEHTLQLRQRADHFDFHDTADQVERLVKQQEEMLLNIATRQIRDTGRLYHVKESNNVEYDLDETLV